MKEQIEREKVMTMRISKAEDKAIAALAKSEGLPKSLFVRRLVHLKIDQNRDSLPDEIIVELYGKIKVKR